MKCFLTGMILFLYINTYGQSTDLLKITDKEFSNKIDKLTFDGIVKRQLPHHFIRFYTLPGAEKQSDGYLYYYYDKPKYDSWDLASFNIFEITYRLDGKNVIITKIDKNWIYTVPFKDSFFSKKFVEYLNAYKKRIQSKY